MKQEEWDKLRYFDPDEMFRAADGYMKRSFPEPERMDGEMMRLLDKARKKAGIRFTITSSYRPGDPKSHGKGLAVDIRAHGSMERKKIAKALDAVGFLRIGIYDKHIHADLDFDAPEGWWGGKSK